MLSDGGFTSGEAIGGRLRISRAAVHKHISYLARQGVPIHRVRGRGYRLASDVHLLNEQVIRQSLDPGIWRQVKRLVILPEVDSTSEWLRRQSPASLPGLVCAAEAQTSGRGRRGSDWIASPYRNMLFSLGWEYDRWPQSVTGLGLATAVAVLRALRALSITGVDIKWPNDLLVDGRKLGGILIDVSGESDGRCTVVLGLGINVHLDARDAARIEQAWTDLRTLTGTVVDRNRLIAHCVAQIIPMLDQFGRCGFPAFRAEWEDHHAYARRRVRITAAGEAVDGLVLGVDDQGALLVRDNAERTRRFVGGDVRLRALA